MIQLENLMFTGNYALLCQNFIHYKRSLGYAYDVRQCYSVKYLCDYLATHGGTVSGLSRDVVEGYIRHKGTESPSTQSKRAYIIRQFGMYLTSLGYESYLPPYDCIKLDKSFVPYIYSKDEIAAIINESEKLQKVYQAPNSYLVYPMLLRILFGCGLRVSEALKLKEDDIDLDNGTIHVEKSKFNNSRIVPMASGLWDKCRDYYNKADHYPADGRYFFEVRPGVPYRRDSVYNRFRFFLEQAGITHYGRGSGPRLHDARHTYSVYALEHMVQQGMDIYCALPILSVYLGHRTIESTEKYVRLIPAFHQNIIHSMEGMYDGLFPEVKNERKQ
ncbi:MAG: tyrosine-type recombinase/integrase [Clostridiaceae bacterium]|nr:tyrosine-type recombinase/integrase [Clostridiaceae bacterium]